MAIRPGEQLLVAVGERLRGRRRRARRLAREREAGVERVGVEVDVVAQVLLVAEAHGQRHHPQVGEPVGVVGEVGGRVDHDRRVVRADHASIMKHALPGAHSTASRAIG